MSVSRQNSDDPYVVRRIGLMGSPFVGKSTLSSKFVLGYARDVYQWTIEDVYTKNYWFNQKRMALKIIDTAGHLDYSIFPHGCSFGIDGFLIVYAIDNLESFKAVEKIYEMIIDNAGIIVPVVLVGNKLDIHSERVVTTKQGEELAKKLKVPFIEFSAKETENVNQVFDMILYEVEKDRGNIPEKKKSTCTIC